MNQLKISPKDFAINHPAGSLGKKLTLTVKDLMIPASKIKPFLKETLLPEIITGLTRDGIGCGWVANSHSSKKIVGIITDGDLRRSMQCRNSIEWPKLSANNIMTENPITIKSDILVIDAIEIMESNIKKPISILPVISDEGYISGFLRLHDAIQEGLR